MIFHNIPFLLQKKNKDFYISPPGVSGISEILRPLHYRVQQGAHLKNMMMMLVVVVMMVLVVVVMMVVIVMVMVRYFVTVRTAMRMVTVMIIVIVIKIYRYRDMPTMKKHK